MTDLVRQYWENDRQIAKLFDFENGICPSEQQCREHKQKQEVLLLFMTDDEIQEIIDGTTNIYGKIYLESFKENKE